MANISELISALPPMLSGDELRNTLGVFPAYDPGIREATSTERLVALSDLYKVYVPSVMSVEIYSKMYLALMRSLSKKEGIVAVQQVNENRKAILQREYRGIMGGSDSFTIIGSSGIGKSTSISRVVSLIGGTSVITLENPMAKIIPCVIVQCPFDASVKGMLLEILRTVDEVLGSRYYECAVRSHATTDMLIGSVSQVALNHIGLLIVDEIQNVVNSKNGKVLIGALTQLINNSGISICMVGTPESAVFFEQGMQLARRSLGLQYGRMEYDEQFSVLCRTLLRYQYVKNPADKSDSLIYWLYEHSQGITALVVSLIHDAQEISILNGHETLDINSLDEAYKKRLALMHGYIQTPIRKVSAKKKSVSKTEKAAHPANRTELPQEIMTEDTQPIVSQERLSIAECVRIAKGTGSDVFKLIKAYYPVEEVPV